VSRAEVFAGVRDCLAAALDVEPGAVREEQRIIGDLGADSLDLLDLTFQLERRFGVSISPRDIERRARERLGGAALDIEGVYTRQALGELRMALPEIPPEELADGLTTAELPRKFRVATMVRLVQSLLGENRG